MVRPLPTTITSVWGDVVEVPLSPADKGSDKGQGQDKGSDKGQGQDKGSDKG